jgi:hypothetical protein
MLKPNRQPTRWLLLLALGVGALGVALADEPSPDWPRRAEMAPYRVTLHEPTAESFDQEWLTARAAVTVVRNTADPVFGAIWFGLRLQVNAAGTHGRVTAFRLEQMRFPEGVVIERAVLDQMLGNNLVNADLVLAPLLASLERDRAAADAAAAGNEAVPDILFTTVPVALVRIDGEAVLKDIPDSDLLTVVNSNTAIFLQKGTAQWFMSIDGRWLTAAAVEGPWQDATGVPESVRQAVGETPAATSVLHPTIVVVTRATEVIAVDGEPRYMVIPGTDLLSVNNTDADLFLDIAGQKHYALLAGRWFATVDLVRGPWEAVPSERLPETFRRIPPYSPKYGVLAHIPGTSLAQEAVQDAAVPKVQKVTREALNLTVEYEGEPEFVPAGQTTVTYAVNTPYSVVHVAPYYYLCHSGVWYYGVAAGGPWAVCVSVPGVIYSIPPACPVYPVTYVRVYDWTPSTVWFGYTSGYVGWYVGWSGLVFGFAYYDDVWWRHHRAVYYGHRSYYHYPAHHYRCGYYPRHGSYHSGRGPHGRPAYASTRTQAPIHMRDRPGPEVHQFAGGKPYGGASDSRVRAVSLKPNRYDQEPSATLSGKARGGDRGALAAAGRTGKPERGLTATADNGGRYPGVRTGAKADPGTVPTPAGRSAFGESAERDGARTLGKSTTPRDATTGFERSGKSATPREATTEFERSGKSTTPRDATTGFERSGKSATPREATVASERQGRPAATGVTSGEAGSSERTAVPKAITPRAPADGTVSSERTGKAAATVPAIRSDLPQTPASAGKPAQGTPAPVQPQARPVTPAPAPPSKRAAPENDSGKETGGKVNSSYFQERYGTGLVQTAPSPRPARVVAPESSSLVRSASSKSVAATAPSVRVAPTQTVERAPQTSPLVRSAPVPETTARRSAPEGYAAPAAPAARPSASSAYTGKGAGWAGQVAGAVPGAAEATGTASPAWGTTSTVTRGSSRGSGKGR